MKIQEIENLIHKYFEGETSLDEEAQLSEYFADQDIAPQLTQYQPLFQFFQVEKDILLPQQAAEKLSIIQKPVVKLSVLRGSGMWWRAAAAVFILGVSSYFITQQFESANKKCIADNCRVKIYDENDDPQKAYEEVQAALKLVSRKMKKGTDETQAGMKKVKDVTDNVEKIIHINDEN